MIRTARFDNGKDFVTQRELVELYQIGSSFPFAPIMHQALTGVAGMWMHLAWWDDSEGRRLAGAGMLKSPEAVIPIGQEIQPLAWVISDVVTHPDYRRKGVARVLLKHMEGVAYRNGGRILYLYTEETNAPACHLYETCRFTRLKSQSGQAVFAKLLGAD